MDFGWDQPFQPLHQNECFTLGADDDFRFLTKSPCSLTFFNKFSASGEAAAALTVGVILFSFLVSLPCFSFLPSLAGFLFLLLSEDGEYSLPVNFLYSALAASRP